MLKICKEKWAENSHKLKEVLSKDTTLNSCDYKYLVKLTIKYILNTEDDEWDVEHITEIDNGDYQGTLLWMIPRDTYQPSCYEYLITYCYYGSCSGCDTLLGIQEDIYDDSDTILPTEIQLKQYMDLCKDIICNIKRPYYSQMWYEGCPDDWFEVKEKEVLENG